MKLSQAASILLAIANHLVVSAQNDTTTDAATPTTTAECTLEAIPIREDDFGEPDWETILEIAFPTWATPANGCPRLSSLDGDLAEGYTEFPVPEAGKFNPCYYTKAFAGLDPMLGGYPSPIDTKYAYEFAAPFYRQPGDGSVHHCAHDEMDVGACPKFQNDCGKDCSSITEEYGIGHIPPFVPLAAVKNAYNSCTQDICAEWFDFESSGCNIVKDKLDEIVLEYFKDADSETVKFPGPVVIDGVPTRTYYRLEYLGQSPACDEGNCRGPHYCSKEAADAGIWGDFCPYVLTGEDSGQYRHPHLALAALELWIANQCMPDKCAPQWLDSPNGENYGTDPMKSTSITWAQMVDNSDPMAQPAVPYIWPNVGDGVFPGLEALYGDMESKDIEGTMELDSVDYDGSDEDMPATMPADGDEPADDTEDVTATEPADESTPPPTPSSAHVMSVSLAAIVLLMVGAIVM